nr:hypothetical protein [Tanacetum cinerariifolium]
MALGIASVDMRVMPGMCQACVRLLEGRGKYKRDWAFGFGPELTFFLGLQVKQKNDGTFISQDKYVAENLKKFGFTEVKTASTLMETLKPLLKDEYGEKVDVHMYRSMIDSLIYLTSSRPDIVFAVLCACATYQVNQTVLYLHAAKRILRYLKGQPKLGLWYLKDSSFDLVAYTDSDYVGASLDRKSTIGGKAKKSVRLMMEKLFGMELELIMLIHAKVNGKKIIVTESFVRRDLRQVDEEGIDCLSNSNIFEQLALMGIRKGYSGRVTPLFLTMMVQNQSELGEGSAMPTDPHHTPTILQPSSSQPQKTQKPRKPRRKDTQ